MVSEHNSNNKKLKLMQTIQGEGEPEVHHTCKNNQEKKKPLKVQFSQIGFNKRYSRLYEKKQHAYNSSCNWIISNRSKINKLWRVHRPCIESKSPKNSKQKTKINKLCMIN